MTFKKKIFADNISKTGFILEHKVSKILKSYGWNIINNKHYIDDVTKNAREIDIIAYKATPLKYFTLITSLIISCKKDSENAWVLLARDKPKIDPNKNWAPLQHWTNSKSIQFMTSQEGWDNNFINSDYELSTKIFNTTKNVFAFQKMNTSTGKPKDDKPIFDSLSSLMKCQQYEISSLNSRKKETFFYSFNLISVIDSDLILLEIDNDDNIEEKEICEEKYIADYIVDGKAVCSRIHFIKADSFEGEVNNYNLLHEYNVNQIENTDNQFYADVLKLEKKSDIFKKQFISSVSLYYSWALRDLRLSPPKREDLYIYFEWDKEKEILKIGVYGDGLYEHSDRIFKYFNTEKDVQKTTREALLKFYRYEGKFVFDEVMPF